MNELPNPSAPPPEPAATPEHPAPPSTWKPLSGWALTAFVLSLVLIVVALYGYWIVEALPLAIGIITLKKVKRGEKRGRLFALWAIIIAFGVGSCSYMIHSGSRGIFSKTAESLMSVLSSQSPTEQKAESLRAWAWPKALEKDPKLPTTWMDRYAGVVAKYGPWLERFDLPSLWSGMRSMLMTPADVVEIGSDDVKPPAWPPWAAFWVKAPFEKGMVYVAVVFQDGGQDAGMALKELKPKEESAIIGDVRFYRAKAEKLP